MSLLCSCSIRHEVSREVIDKRCTHVPAFAESDPWDGEVNQDSFDKYELQYLITYDDGFKKEIWFVVTEEEYLKEEI